MCRFLMRLVACAIAATVLVLTSPGKPRADVDEAKQLIVMIDGEMRGGKFIGAGIIIGWGSDRLYIATANHVVRRGTKKLEQVRVRLRFLPGQDVKAEILSDFDRNLDLAVLSVKGVKDLAIPVDEIPFQRLGAADGLKRGDEVFTIGYPLGKRWHVNVSPDLVSENIGDNLEFESRFVANGHSGGGLFNKDWELVGMITADQPPNGVAVRIDRVLEQLKRWDYPLGLKRTAAVVPPPEPPVPPPVGEDVGVYAIELPKEPTPPPASAEPSVKLAVGVYPKTYDPGDTFKDCDTCPEMVVIREGNFMMGSPPDEEGRHTDEGPQHQVTIRKPFAVGKFEVMFREWDACVADGGCNRYRPRDKRWGRGNRPVINVDWDDTKRYLDWLSRKTGVEYRLLSEAEWEYAARAGTTTPFHFGSTISPDQANYDGESTYGSGRVGVWRKKTVPVGSFPSNAFGLHDVHGNVWEWVEDCWNGRYAGAPSDGAAWTAGNCEKRVLRGGSWSWKPKDARSASRYWGWTANRLFNRGFRAARTLP